MTDSSGVPGEFCDQRHEAHIGPLPQTIWVISSQRLSCTTAHCKHAVNAPAVLQRIHRFTKKKKRWGHGGAAGCPVSPMAESLYAGRACSVCCGTDVKWTAVQVYKRSSINNREREPGQRMHTPLLGGSADSTADRPKEGSSVSIMVSLQIIYISPLLLCCPQAHKASFSMLLLAIGVRQTSSEVYCGWSKGVGTNAHRHTRTARCSVSTGFHRETAILTRMIHVQVSLTAE